MYDEKTGKPVGSVLLLQRHPDVFPERQDVERWVDQDPYWQNKGEGRFDEARRARTGGALLTLTDNLLRPTTSPLSSCDFSLCSLGASRDQSFRCSDDPFKVTLAGCRVIPIVTCSQSESY